MKLEELRVYQLSMNLAEEIWNIVVKWDFFTKDTVGKQLVKSADSVAANLSEGFADIFIKKKDNSVIINEALCMKQKPG